jgi:hypothetical protein
MLAKKLLFLLLFLGGLSITTATTDIESLQTSLEIAEYDTTASQKDLSELIEFIAAHINYDDIKTISSFKALLVRAFYLRATRYPSDEVFIDVLKAINIEQELQESRLSSNTDLKPISNAELAAVYLAQARYNRSDNEPQVALVALNAGLRLVPNAPSILQERAFLYREMQEEDLSEKDKNTLLSLATSRRARANDRAYIFVLLAELAQTPEERLFYTQQARISMEASGVFEFDMASIEPRLKRLEAEFAPVVAPKTIESVAEPSVAPVTKAMLVKPAIQPAASLEQGIKSQELVNIIQRSMP